MSDQSAGRAPEPPPVTPILRSGGETLRGHTGPLAYDPTECQALVADGTQGCAVRGTWRVTAAEVDHEPFGQYDMQRELTMTVRLNGEAPSWLVCQPHLGETIMLVNDTYGVPVVVDRA